MGHERDLEQVEHTAGVISIGTYSFEQTLGDAIFYHASCSIAIGFETSIRIMDDKIGHQRVEY
ncbi:MAG: hypothetical protein ACWA5L_01865 [bacterium]